MRFLIILFLIVYLPFSAKGQITSLFDQEENDSSQVEIPPVLEVGDSVPTPSDLIIAYEESAQTIREIRTDLLTGFHVDGMRRDYEELHDQLLQYYEIDSSQIRRSSLSAVNDRIIIFERRNEELSAWQEELTKYTSTLSDYRIKLTRIGEKLYMD
ncbi:MAG: hypothetical protein P8X57_08295, partial [Cyclobacteriaceae bacterium]